TAHCSRVGKRTPNKNTTRTQRLRFEDISATPYPAVEHDRNIPGDIGNFRQYAQRGNTAVQLAAAMIGNNDAVNTDLNRCGGIRFAQDTLNDQWSFPLLPDGT